jgi:hypothetical protein
MHGEVDELTPHSVSRSRTRVLTSKLPDLLNANRKKLGKSGIEPLAGMAIVPSFGVSPSIQQPVEFDECLAGLRSGCWSESAGLKFLHACANGNRDACNQLADAPRAARWSGLRPRAFAIGQGTAIPKPSRTARIGMPKVAAWKWLPRRVAALSIPWAAISMQ